MNGTFFSFRTLALMMIVMLSTSCAGPIVIQDDGQTINLSEDDPFTVELPGNSSTGYVWKLLPYNREVVKQIGDRTFEPKDDRIGSGGVFSYQFQTVGDGATELIFEYNRKWDTVALPARTFHVKIVSGTMGRILEE